MCTANVTAATSFTGHDVELFRYVATLVGWRESAGSANASVASGQWAFRCSSHYWYSVLALMAANKTEDPALAPCSVLIGAVIPTALRYEAGNLFSAPYYHTGLSIMVASDAHTYFDIWGFLKPFRWTMWLSLGLTLMFMPAIVWFVEHLNVHGYIPLSWDSLQECKEATYSTLLACFNIKVYDVTTLPARLVVIMYLFLILITISTYTANLASVFTTTTTISKTITSWQDLTYAPVAAPAVYCSGLETRYGLQDLIPGALVGASIAQLAQGRDDILNKKITAYVTFLENIQQFLGAQGYNDDCKLSLLKFDVLEPAFNFAISFHTAFPRALIDVNVNAAIALAEESGLLFSLSQKYLSYVDSCADPATAAASIHFYQLSGLWIILAAALGVAICWTAVTIVLLARSHMRDIQSDQRCESARDGGSSAGGAVTPSGTKMMRTAMGRVFVPHSKLHRVRQNSGLSTDSDQNAHQGYSLQARAFSCSRLSGQPKQPLPFGYQSRSPSTRSRGDAVSPRSAGEDGPSHEPRLRWPTADHPLQSGGGGDAGDKTEAPPSRQLSRQLSRENSGEVSTVSALPFLAHPRLPTLRLLVGQGAPAQGVEAAGWDEVGQQSPRGAAWVALSQRRDRGGGDATAGSSEDGGGPQAAVTVLMDGAAAVHLRQ